MGNVERLPVRSAERVAVLLNANARSVSETLKRELENFVPPEDLYYSRCFDDARSIARQVLEKGYRTDRKSTRLNSSHDQISYAVFCLKKKTRNDATIVALIPRTTRRYHHLA